jgi:antitoxin component YwqK of YwqJK toxin-antitoxin module
MAYGDVTNSVDNETPLQMVSRIETKLKNGKWKEFNKHAVLVAEGSYVNGKKHGTWREYYDHTGTIMIEEDYEHGVQHGRFVSYHPNGRMLSRGWFCLGSREGYFRVYDEEGQNVRNLLFANNIQVNEIKIIYTDEHQGQARNTG